MLNVFRLSTRIESLLVRCSSGRDDGGGFNPDFNTYGLSIKFLEGLGIQGPLHTRIFIANVSISNLANAEFRFFLSFFLFFPPFIFGFFL